jgi:hypothetical protein
MERFILVFAAGLIATASSVGAVNAADPSEAVAAPMPNPTSTTVTSPVPGTQPSPYQFYNGNWWYRMPDGRWLYYVNGQWVSPPPPAAAPVYAYPNYVMAPGPYYYPYPYGYGYPSVTGGLWIGGGWGGWGGGWHGGGCGGHR